MPIAIPVAPCSIGRTDRFESAITSSSKVSAYISITPAGAFISHTAATASANPVEALKSSAQSSANMTATGKTALANISATRKSQYTVIR